MERKRAAIAKERWGDFPVPQRREKEFASWWQRNSPLGRIRRWR